MENKIELSKIKNLVGKRSIIKRYVLFILGVFILAVSYNLFVLPNNLVYGGVSGIAVITKNIIDPSLFILIANVFLLALSLLMLGREKTAGSILGILLFPLFVKITSNIGDIIVLKDGDLLLNVIFAGFLSGIAGGTILKNGFSTGGSDILTQIVSKMFKISLGKSYILVDGLIIIIGGIYLGFVNSMYALVLLYIYSIMTDKIVLGISNNKAFYIITDKEDEVKSYILDNLNHGVTIIKAKGGYEGHKTNVLLCVVPARHYFKLKEGISLIDEQAFFVVTDAYEVKGGA